MPMDKRDPAYLLDMLEAGKKVIEFVKGKRYHDYLSSDLLQSAVERNIELIGEASRRVSTSFKEDHPEIPWSGMIA